MALLAYYRMNGNSNDASGNGYNGTDTSMTYESTVGIKNGSAKFASGSVISANVAATTFGNGPRTLMALINTTKSGDSRIIGNRSNSVTWVGIQISGENGKFTLEMGGSYPTNYKGVDSASAVNNGKWNHCVAVTNGNNIYMWVNGKLETETTWTAFSTNSTYGTPKTHIGMYFEAGLVPPRYETSSQFLGNIDELKTYNHAFSHAQVKNEYSRLKGFF